MVSFRSAVHLYGLGDLDADRHEFTVPGRKQSRRADIRIHRGDLKPDDWRLVDGLPVTAVVKTIEDLARAHTDGGHLANVVRDALTSPTADADRIVAVLRPYAHQYGAALGDGEGLVTRFLDEAGLPRATRQAVELAPMDKETAEALTRLLPALQQAENMQRVATGVMESNKPALDALRRISSDPALQRLLREAGTQTAAIERLLRKTGGGRA